MDKIVWNLIDFLRFLDYFLWDISLYFISLKNQRYLTSDRIHVTFSQAFRVMWIKKNLHYLYPHDIYVSSRVVKTLGNNHKDSMRILCRGWWIHVTSARKCTESMWVFCDCWNGNRVCCTESNIKILFCGCRVSKGG